MIITRPPTPTPIVLADRWRQYTRHGDRVVRDQLILAYSPLVKQVAGRIASNLPPHVDLADLISYGLGGLISAVERFEPARGIRFETYASLRIRGAIFDELRTMDWVPRGVREEGRRIEHAVATLTTRLQRVPSDEELAEQLSLTAPQLDHALQRAEMSRMVALDRPRPFDGASADTFTLLDTLVDPRAPDPAEASDHAELVARLAGAIQQLSSREQTVLGLRYHQQLTYLEIGEVLQVTESRVSQIHTKCIIGLRALLTPPSPIADDWERPALAEREAILS
jgi:RNA polymerase sigma factor for flagellar operon FliA